MPTSRLTRRQLMGGMAASLATAAWSARRGTSVLPALQPGELIGPYPAAVLPARLRSRFVTGVNGLRMHVLEAGFAGATRSTER